MDNEKMDQEKYSNEIASCSSFYESVLMPKKKELEKIQYKFIDLIQDFLEENGFSFDEFMKFLRFDHSRIDLDYMQELYELTNVNRIMQELMRDYYNSVFTLEDLYDDM